MHAYTASGAVLALLATHAATALNFRSAFLCLFAAVLVDSTLILQLTTPNRPLAWVSLAFPAYYTALSFVLQARRRRSRR